MDETYDYIIVGAGSAGCVMANRLTASGEHRVLLLEAGPPDNTPWIHVPLGYGKAIYDDRYTRQYETEPDPGMAGRKLVWPRGIVLGGSSSINGMIFIRGQAQDYDGWAALGNAGWAWKDVLPYFRKQEHNTRGASELHGADGPLWCSAFRDPDELYETIFRAAESLGVPRTDDFNGPSQEGVGYYQFFIKQGWRCSAAVAYLKPARRRPNLRVETNAIAERLVIKGGRATGVHFLQGGMSRLARASREVIVCAGAIQSPHLLQVSGIGNASLLAQKGVKVVHDLPGVGENLQDHLNVRSVYKVSRPITVNDSLNSLPGRMGMGLNYMLRKRGPLACSSAPGGLFTAVLPESKTPDIQFHFAALSTENIRYQPHKFSGVTFSMCQLRPESRGRVQLKSADIREAPAIHPNYLAAETDRRCMLAGLKFSRRIAAASPLKGLLTEEHAPGPSVQSDEALMDFIRGTAGTIFHPSGTCKMGSDPMAVVDARLRVHGIAGLRVVDCSIMPTLISGNTNSPTIMIAEKASEMVLQDVRAAAPAVVAEAVH